jgi:hypothetical protein
MSENIISVNIPNMITIGIMFVLFTLLVHGVTKLVRGGMSANNGANSGESEE